MPNATLVDTNTVPVGTAGNPLIVSGGGVTATDVNLTKVAGVATKTGAGTAADALRVELPTDGTGKVGLNAGSAIIGNVRIDQTTPGTTNAVQANAGTNLNTSALATSAQIGEVQASPTANTVLDRLKALLTGIILAAGSAIIGKVGIDQTTPGTTNLVAVKNVTNGEYETVAASQTAQVLGATGATGDYIGSLLVIPATTSPGLVTLLDNATSIPVFVGGASSVSNLVPFTVQLGMQSVSGAWKVTTGANVSVIGIGDFT